MSTRDQSNGALIDPAIAPRMSSSHPEDERPESPPFNTKLEMDPGRHRRNHQEQEKSRATQRLVMLVTVEKSNATANYLVIRVSSEIIQSYVPTKDRERKDG